MSSGAGEELAGRSVLLTRSVAESAALAEALRARGAAVEVLPTTRQEPTPSEAVELTPLDEPERYTHVVFTSRVAVRYFLELIERRLGPLATQALAAWKRRHVAAVGRATADVLRAAGLDVQTLAPPAEVSRVGGARALAEEMLTGAVLRPGDRVALPQSRRAPAEFRRWLRPSGAVVDRIPLYDTVSEEAAGAAGFLQALERGQTPQAVVFYSPSAVRGFLDMTGAAGADVLRDDAVGVVSIGATTSRALGELGFEVAAQSAQPSVEALRAAVAEALRAR